MLHTDYFLNFLVTNLILLLTLEKAHELSSPTAVFHILFSGIAVLLVFKESYP